MCIAVLSTAHPSYRLILIDNRDEYINRPTATAQWWPAPNSDVLGGRDLLRDVHGTWLGVTKAGKVAVLTNFREEKPVPADAISRGAIIRKWLAEDVGSTEEFVTSVISTGIARDAGGFSLVCGIAGERLAVVSNRAADQSHVPWICGETVQTVGLSNAAFSDRSWKKVRDGEELMLHAIKQCIKEKSDESTLIRRLLEVLSRDTLERLSGGLESGIEAHVKALRNTILVPALGQRDESDLSADEIARAATQETVEVMSEKGLHTGKKLGVGGLYGTQKQTVLLVRSDHSVRFFERTLFDDRSNSIPQGQGDVDIQFDIES